MADGNVIDWNKAFKKMNEKKALQVLRKGCVEQGRKKGNDVFLFTALDALGVLADFLEVDGWNET